MRLEVVEGDITALEVDAIANAANDHLWMGAGVAGAIKRGGGEEIEREAVAKGPIAVGDAVATGAGQLKARHVIHGAVMGQDLRTSAALVERTTRRCLEVADGLDSAAMEERLRARGLVCAGGEATRLQELTRVTNKHLLPVGRWPMIYYPLQLLQLAGIREVLIVTGQQHAGDFIDLLGDGRVRERDGDGLIFDLDLTYKVQTEAGGIAQVVGMAESFAADEKLVVCLGDNIFEYAENEAIRGFADGEAGAQIFVKEVPDPERFGVVAYGKGGRILDIVEKAGTLDRRYDGPPSHDAVVGLYCYGPDVFDIIRGLERSERHELEITDVNRAYVLRGDLDVCRVRGWWRDAGTHEALGLIGTLIDETGVNKLA